MNQVRPITPRFAVTGVLRLDDFGDIAAAGFKSVLSNLPDGESPAYPASTQEAEAAARAGLAFRHLPARKADLFTAGLLDAIEAALRELPGPVLAHCASGQRSALAWAAAAARLQPATEVMATMQRAGFDLSAIQDELEALRDPTRTDAIPPGLDAGEGRGS
ncbi:MAG TPA: TIGR01244 family sulfur transferase [Hyphomicrobiaceae bacterium]|nr:TIGR01244 family sulfur transferase [Hyphomicrobiaceae bacterium]